MLSLDYSIRQTIGDDYFKLDEAFVNPEWVQRHQASLVEEKRQNIFRKFEADKESLANKGDDIVLTSANMEERVESVRQMERGFQRENETGTIECDSKKASVDKLKRDITKLEGRIKAAVFQAEDKESNKEIALSTSKMVSCSTYVQNSVILVHFSYVCIELYRPTAYRSLLEKV